MKFTLPELKFDTGALEPYIDKVTMEIHHQKHHGTYISNLNAALEGEETFSDWSIEKLLSHLDQIPEAKRAAVRNNGGGHYNHTLFWESLVPADRSKEMSEGFK
ncbi:MAG: superoxide dismutase, partial [Spirochaetes bacterium]|nr:superoxide dismutase [Spirochaetota bacterium]